MLPPFCLCYHCPHAGVSSVVVSVPLQHPLFYNLCFFLSTYVLEAADVLGFFSQMSRNLSETKVVLRFSELCSPSVSVLSQRCSLPF